MNDRFKELAKALAQSVIRRSALKQFGAVFRRVQIRAIFNRQGDATAGGCRSVPRDSCSLRLITLTLLPVLVAGCAGTFHEVRTLSPGRPPTEQPTVLVLGNVDVTDNRLSVTEKEVYRLKFQQGMETWLSKTNVFQSVVSGTNAPSNGVLLSGNINEVEKGSAAARFWVGMGAGQERIQGEFEIKDPTGQSLTRFSARRSYLGGVGGGGGDMISTEELMSRLGETVAETIVLWIEGKRIE